MSLFLKRLFDLAASAVLLILLFPLFLLIALLIRLESPGPIFFRQERLGRGEGKPTFRIFKFRTMVDNAINLGTGIKTAPGDPRITRIGNILRKSSLDELPQLFNVLLGDMSMVGPRPVIPAYYPRDPEGFEIRARMRPGITGLAQINGRSSILLIERLKFDVKYVQEFSLWLDFLILLKTPLVVLKADGLYYRKSLAKIPSETAQSKDRQ